LVESMDNLQEANEGRVLIPYAGGRRDPSVNWLQKVIRGPP
jgi:hypothetical protein